MSWRLAGSDPTWEGKVSRPLLSASGGPTVSHQHRAPPRVITAAVAILIIALFASPAQAQSDRSLRISFAAAVTAHGMDLSTTAWCRGAGTCREANPALRWAQDDALALGAAKMGVAAGSLLASAALARRGHKRAAFWLNVAQTVTFTAIAIRNTRQVR